MIASPLRPVLAAVAVLAVAGCVSSHVLNADQAGIWIKEPLVGFGDPEGIAREHCARYGRDAEFDTEIIVADGEFRAIHVYLCR